jgi:flavin-dependent dehydrogenase
MATEAADLLVVGGGPAGLATAIRARLEGLEVLLVDPGNPPIDRACGEGVMPDGADRLRDLGVEVPEEEASPFRGIRYIDDDTVAEGSFGHGVGLGVRRVDLHSCLCRRADETGVRSMWGVRATGLCRGGVETDHGALHARWLVAADGRSSRMRGWCGLDGVSPRPGRYGVRRHYRVAPWTDVVEVYWSDGVEAYVTPVGRSTVGVAVLTRGEPAAFDPLLERFPALRRRLGGAESASRDRGAGPFGHRPKAVVLDRVAFVGDASGSLDPISGEGLAASFQQAFAVVAAISRGDLSRYVREHRRLMRVPRLLTGVLLAAERRPGLRRRLIRLLAARPALFDQLLEVRGRRALGARGVLSLAVALVGGSA